MFYFRNSDFKIPDALTVNGKKKSLQLRKVDIQEFTSICIYDCYFLKYLKRSLSGVNYIIDIGSNQGMFLIAARQVFRNARIIGYEPNENLRTILDYNSKQLNAEVYYKAVMNDNCMVDLQFASSDLATTAHKSEFGTVPGISIKKVIENIGKIDILKMDCEGSEWQLFEEKSVWRHIRSLCLEYHLWATKMERNEVLILLNQLGFQIKQHTILSACQGIIIAINKEFRVNE
jgi:FkbM family methyltransferase